MSGSGTPAAEVVIDPSTVSALLQQQAPELAELALSRFGEGFDNVLFRLGDELMVRLPRRAVAAELVAGEQRCLPEIAKGLSIAVPAPVVSGAPGCGFPWPWSVVPWVDGEDSDLSPMSASSATAWLGFLFELHQLTVRDAPINPFRGVPLSHREQAVSERLESLEAATNMVNPALRSAWQEALEADAATTDRTRCWVHGDLHPRNVLTRNGEVAAVIDWGDLCEGDPATDLASVWMHFPNQATDLEKKIVASGHYDADIIARARGWALSFGVLLADTGRIDDARHYAVGARTLSALSRLAAP